MRTPSLLAAIAVLCGSLSAQQLANSLEIVVLAGHDASVSMRANSGPPIRVRVTDDGKPVKNATVTAMLPPMGPGGAFRGGETIRSEQTNDSGEVSFPGYRLRHVAGEIPVKLVARVGGKTGRTVVHQNALDASPVQRGFWTRRRTVMVAILGGGAAAAVVAGMQNAKEAPQGAAFSVTPGQPLVGGPR